MINKVTFVGMGALGILYGSKLVENLGAENVCFLADGDRLARYQRDGAYCNGEKCDFRFSDGKVGEEAELLLFAVKAPALEEAMELAAPCVGEDTVILSLLNGVTSEEILSRRFGGEKVLYTVTQGMDAVRVGNSLTYTQSGKFFTGIPEDDPFEREEKLDAVEEVLTRGGLPFVREPDILHRMWCKFMMNVGINQVCMAFETDYGGAQREGEVRDTMVAAMNEVRKVSACQGVLLTQKDLQEYVGVVDSLSANAMPSMRQDGLAHRHSEVELFSGAVIEIADFYGMNVPVNRMLYDRITAMEAAWE